MLFTRYFVSYITFKSALQYSVLRYFVPTVAPAPLHLPAIISNYCIGSQPLSNPHWLNFNPPAYSN